MSARPTFLKAAAAFALAAAMLQGQVTPTPVQAPPEALAALRASTGTAQDLALPRSSTVPFEVRVHLAGAERTLSLAPHDVRSPDFQLLVHDATGVHPVPAPPSVTFRGGVSGMPDTEVAASLVDGQLFATIHASDGEVWGIQPLSELIAALPRQVHVVYRASDVSVPEGVRCGVADGDVKHEHHDVGPAAIKVADIAIDADLAYYNRYGARTTNIYAWNGDLCNLLGQFRSYWNANHGGVVRDLAHLFTGEGTFSGVVGCAYVGVVCGSSAYGASKVYHGNLVTDTGLVAHEIGHNWNAPHCNSSPPCHIMCSGLGGCAGNLTSFSPGEVAVIVAFKNSRGCLSDPAPTTLVPARNYNMEGHSGVVLPFNNNNMIMQQLMPPADVGLANGAVITRITFVREANFATSSMGTDLNVQPFTMDRVEIRLENTSAAALSSTAANNTHWTGSVVPAPRSVSAPLNVPGYTSPGPTGPGGVNYVSFALLPPLVYNNAQNLLLEVRNVAASQTDSSPPAPGNLTDRSLATGFAATRGYGCPNNAGQFPNFGTFSGLYALNTLTTGQITNPSTTVAAWAYWFGLQFQNVFGGPPGLAFNTIFPGVGPSCKFWVNPDVLITGSGTTFPQTFSVFIPNSMALLGSPLGTQAVFIDTNAPGSVTVSPGLYAFVKTANPSNACQLVLRTGAGNFASPAADALPLNSIPVQAYAVTVKLN
jgi:hypothetical protein